MANAKLIYWSSILLALSFIITGVTGIIMFFFVPFGEPGVGRRGFIEFLGITKNTWMAWHNWAGLAMIVLAVIHIIIFWRPLVAIGRNVFKKKRI